MSKSSKDGDEQASEEATCNVPGLIVLTASEAKQTKAPRPHNCRNFIRKQTANAIPAIVNTFVDKAKEGSVPHFASLAKIGGFDQRQTSEAPKRRRKSLARQLLDEVEKYEAEQAAELAAANAATSQIGNPGPQERS